MGTARKGASLSTCLTHCSFQTRGSDKAHGAAGSQAGDILFRWGQITLHQLPSFQTHRTRTKQAWHAWLFRQRSLVPLLENNLSHMQWQLIGNRPMLFRIWNNSSHKYFSHTLRPRERGATAPSRVWLLTAHGRWY